MVLATTVVMSAQDGACLFETQLPSGPLFPTEDPRPKLTTPMLLVAEPEMWLYAPNVMAAPALAQPDTRLFAPRVMAAPAFSPPLTLQFAPSVIAATARMFPMMVELAPDVKAEELQMSPV